jgi:hypothetical protein
MNCDNGFQFEDGNQKQYELLVKYALDETDAKTRQRIESLMKRSPEVKKKIEKIESLVRMMKHQGNTIFSDCPPASLLADYHENPAKLSKKELASVKKHLKVCDSCRDDLAILSGIENELSAGSENEILLFPSPEPHSFPGKDDSRLLAAAPLGRFMLSRPPLTMMSRDGSYKVRVNLDPENNLYCTLVEFHDSLKGKKIRLIIPKLHAQSEPFILDRKGIRVMMNRSGELQLKGIDKIVVVVVKSTTTG